MSSSLPSPLSRDGISIPERAGAARGEDAITAAQLGNRPLPRTQQRSADPKAPAAFRRYWSGPRSRRRGGRCQLLITAPAIQTRILGKDELNKIFKDLMPPAVSPVPAPPWFRSGRLRRRPGSRVGLWPLMANTTTDVLITRGGPKPVRNAERLRPSRGRGWHPSRARTPPPPTSSR